MAKVPIKSCLLLRRWYSVALENARAQPLASAVRDAAGSKLENEKTFWMRDPKTGNWMPENHFGDIDVAEMREKLLTKEKLQKIT